MGDEVRKECAGHEAHHEHVAPGLIVLPASETGTVADVVVVHRLTLVREVVDEILRGRVCSFLMSWPSTN